MKKKHRIYYGKIKELKKIVQMVTGLAGALKSWKSAQ